MTFWDDLRNGLLGISSLTGIIKIFDRFVSIKEVGGDMDDVIASDSLEGMGDEGLKQWSIVSGANPGIISNPIMGTLYSAGYGKLVNRRTSSAYTPNLLSAMDYVTHYNRFDWDKINIDYYLKELGYNNENQTILKDLYQYYPNAPEFVRFGVREVFKPDLVSKYGYDKEFPEEIKPYMKRAGLTEEVMGWFWKAHWELPSFYSIREARWRDEITDTELDEWLMVNDYAPYWREKLKKIIYKPYTRVDVRRMYDSGVVDKDEVKRSYKDIGYDETRAENLTKFTVINSDKTKDVLSTYIKAFSKGIIDKTALVSQMQEMEYSEKEIELRIAMLESVEVVSRSKKELTLTNVKKLYTKGLIDSYTLEDMLIELNYSDKAVMYMKLLIITESVPHKRWTADIKKAYKLDMISRDECVSRLLDIGYTNEAIDLTIAIIDTQKGVEE